MEQRKKIYNKSAFILAALTIFGDRVTLTDALLPFGPNLLSAIREILVFHSILISFLRRSFSFCSWRFDFPTK